MEAFHAELREFIRRLDIEDSKLSLMRQQTRAIREGIRNLYADGLGGSNACFTTIKGTINGCIFPAVALAGASIRLVGHTSGTNYGTFVATNGTYEVSLILVQPETLDAYMKGPGPR